MSVAPTNPVATAPVTSGERRQQVEKLLRDFHEDSALGKAYDLQLLRRLWCFVKPHRSLLYVSVGLGLVTVATGLIRPLLMKWTIDSGVMVKDYQVLLTGAAIFAGVVLFEGAIQTARILATQRLGARTVSDLRSHVFGFLHTLRMRFFDTQPVGRLVTRVTNDTDVLMELTSSGVLNIMTDLLKLIGIVVLMLSLDWQLSIVAFIAVPPVALLVRYVRRWHR
jgi:ATP-binding cassette subfamily B protein